MLRENEVSYTRNKQEAMDNSMMEFSYDCTYMSTSEKKVVKTVIYCHNKMDLLSLMNHWNIVENLHKDRIVYFYTLPYMEFGKEVEWDGT